jgi:hypothetical protein
MIVDINELRKWYKHPNDRWNVSFVCEWGGREWNNESIYDLFISHSFLKHDCSIRKYPDGSVLWDGFAFCYDTHNNDLLSLIEDIIEMSIREFTNGTFDYY